MRILLIAAIAASMVACLKKDKDDKKTKVETKPKADVPKPEPKPQEVVKLEGFQTPESIYYDQANDIYLVSNINGKPTDKDDNGFIARVSPPPGSKVVDATWIDGKHEKVTLNAPKGMAVWSGTLYVADIDTVRMFDATTGAVKGEVKLPGATFVNDLAAGKGVVYASDSALDKDFKPQKNQAIWEIRDGKARKLASGIELGGPNGLLVQGEDLWVVTFGSGEMYKLVDGKREGAEKLPGGGLDGIVVAKDGTLHVSSWEGKAIFSGKPGSWTKGAVEFGSPADIGYDSKRDMVLVPVFMENRIELHPAAGAAPSPVEAPSGEPGPAEKAAGDGGKPATP